MTSVTGAWQGFHAWREARRVSGLERPVHFIPTMGALHEGHAALIRAARTETSAEIVVSVYVNPTQFNDAVDFESYPKTEAADVELAMNAGADVVVFPKPEELYPGGIPDRAPETDYGALTRLWEAEHRQGHFDGVVAVVRELFRETQPHRAFFGEKDWQQLAVIQRLAALEFPGLQVVPVGTVRESGGLAMSSRNARLSASGVERAQALYRGLAQIARQEGAAEVVNAVRAHWVAGGIEVEYLAVVDAEDLTEPRMKHRPGRVIVAAWVEGVRLIDNLPLPPLTQ
jgi:pantoate--beta-alanine ligase